MIGMMTAFWISRGIYVAAKLGIADLLRTIPRRIYRRLHGRRNDRSTECSLPFRLIPLLSARLS